MIDHLKNDNFLCSDYIPNLEIFYKLKICYKYQVHETAKDLLERDFHKNFHGKGIYPLATYDLKDQTLPLLLVFDTQNYKKTFKILHL